MKDIIISLFDYSGSWSLWYERAGYIVIRVDIKNGIDILTWDYKQIQRDRVAGVLAAPPCTHYTVSCNRLWAEKDADGRTEESNALVRKAIEIRDYFNPLFFGLENPVGRLSALFPELGDPWYWSPFQFGEPWTKKTGIWGYFNKPKENWVPVIKFAPQGSWSQLLGGKSERTKEIRSITPYGFARAFFEANNPLGLNIPGEELRLFGQCKYGQWTCGFCTCPDVCEDCDEADSYEPDDFAMSFDSEEDMMKAIFNKGKGIELHVDPKKLF